ncbi:hypothetical protein NKI38_33200 [Mesorhizobium sp. M0621]|uniref:hypothetical protein n=1 Tax=Mesorhizobium sp. M0621 TaxID=2956974 RepID=UPI00333D6794
MLARKPKKDQRCTIAVSAPPHQQKQKAACGRLASYRVLTALRQSVSMKLPVFGRKTSSSPQTSPSPPAGGGDSEAHPGHRAVLAHLRRTEGEQPLARPQLVGRLLFDMICKMIANDRGVRMEDLLAILASTGGFSCLVAALSEVGWSPPDGNSLTIVTGKDSHRYFFGDLPNRYLIESEFALLNLALGAAQACGGSVSLDMVHQTMRHVASTVGGESFGQPQLPAEHRPGDLPFNYVVDREQSAL